MSNALALPAAEIFLLCSYIVLAAGRLSTTNFLLAEPCKCVTVSDVLKHLAAYKCKE